jgi:hypothetical protein
VEGSCEHGNKPSASIKCWEFLEWLHNGQLLKKGSAPWVSEWLSEWTTINLIQAKSVLLIMSAVICGSTEFRGATSAITVSSRVTKALLVSANSSERQMRDYYVSLYSLTCMKSLVDIVTWYIIHICHATQMTPRSSCLAMPLLKYATGNSSMLLARPPTRSSSCTLSATWKLSGT